MNCGSDKIRDARTPPTATDIPFGHTQNLLQVLWKLEPSNGMRQPSNRKTRHGRAAVEPKITTHRLDTCSCASRSGAAHATTQHAQHTVQVHACGCMHAQSTMQRPALPRMMPALGPEQPICTRRGVAQASDAICTPRSVRDFATQCSKSTSQPGA